MESMTRCHIYRADTLFEYKEIPLAQKSGGSPTSKTIHRVHKYLYSIINAPMSYL
jgi:hypothetical protein